MDSNRKTFRPVVFYRIIVLLVVSCLAYASSASANTEIDTKKTKVWGPGLIADATLPARYFFIQPYTKNGEK